MENYKKSAFLIAALGASTFLFAADGSNVSPAQLRIRNGKIQIASTRVLTLQEEAWKKDLEQQKERATSPYNATMINSFLHRVFTIQGLNLEDEKQNLEQLLKQ